MFIAIISCYTNTKQEIRISIYQIDSCFLKIIRKSDYEGKDLVMRQYV